MNYNFRPRLNEMMKGFTYLAGSGISIATNGDLHFIPVVFDPGPIIIQAVVPILPGDTADLLAARILEQEHRVYPRAIQLIAEGRVRVEGRQVIIEPPASPITESLINPALVG